MLSIPPTMRVFVATTAIDMRKSFDGLVGVVRSLIAQDPLSGHLFVFFNKRRTMMKAIRTASRIQRPNSATNPNSALSALTNAESLRPDCVASVSSSMDSQRVSFFFSPNTGAASVLPMSVANAGSG